jgi:magnesium-transporting ATPase (P-type)
MYYALPVESVLSQLGASKTHGLSSDEVASRQKLHGMNVLPMGRKVTFLEKLWNEINSVLIYVLLVGAVLSFAFNHLADAIVILGVIVVNVFVSLYMESKAESTSEKLKAMMSSTATVIRDGQKQTIPSVEVTVGDLVFLTAGDIVPADGRVVASADLNVLEAALTGESHAILKSPVAIGSEHSTVPVAECTNMVFSSTQVLKGTATFVVTGIGKDSEIGKISDMLSNVQHQKTPLMIQLDVFARYLAICIIALALIALGVALGRGYSIADSFSFAIGIAVAAIPEGLPSVVTITFAIGVRYMVSQRAIIKTLPAVETLGSVSVICSDKTGTLTQNSMTVTSFANSLGIFDFTDTGIVGEEEGAKMSEIESLLALLPGLFCNDSVLKQTASPTVSGLGGYEVHGDPTEACIFSIFAKVVDGLVQKDVASVENFIGSSNSGEGSTTTTNVAVTLNGLLKKYPRIAEVAFDSSTKYMATLHEISKVDCARWFGASLVDHVSTPTVRVIFVKGAPERIVSMTSAVPAAWEARNESLASRGMRVLGLAFRIVPPAGAVNATPCSSLDALVDADIFTARREFTMLSLVGIIDPPRPEAIVAVSVAQEAGIAVKMITGDHAGTALAIAKQLGIQRNPTIFGEDVSRITKVRKLSRLRSRSRVGTVEDTMRPVTGRDLDQALNESEALFDQLVLKNHVFARTTPEHKLKIVQSLQRQGIICSMTGDGVNDAPALKAANIGVAMGITGTGVAKEAAKMVITDDNFATIVEAVRIGRCTYHNLVKVLAFVLPTNGGQAFSIIMALVIGLEVPITALQILWVNMITSITLGLVLAFEKPHRDIMHAPPRRSTKPVFGKFLSWRLLFVTVVLVFAVLGNYQWEQQDHPEYSPKRLRTLAVNTLSVCQIAYLFCCRSLRSLSSPYQTFFADSREIWLGIVSVGGFQALFTYAPPFQYIFQTEYMDGWSWGKCLIFGVITYLVIELEKLCAFHTMKSRRRFWMWFCRQSCCLKAAAITKAGNDEFPDLESAAISMEEVEVSDRINNEVAEVRDDSEEEYPVDDFLDESFISLEGERARTLTIPFEEL